MTTMLKSCFFTLRAFFKEEEEGLASIFRCQGQITSHRAHGTSLSEVEGNNNVNRNDKNYFSPCELKLELS